MISVRVKTWSTYDFPGENAAFLSWGLSENNSWWSRRLCLSWRALWCLFSLYTFFFWSISIPVSWLAFPHPQTSFHESKNGVMRFVIFTWSTFHTFAALLQFLNTIISVLWHQLNSFRGSEILLAFLWRTRSSLPPFLLPLGRTQSRGLQMLWNSLARCWKDHPVLRLPLIFLCR